MSAQAEERPEGHPSKPSGEPYAFGGYAFLRLGCRCAGCLDAQAATAAKASAGRAKNTKRAGRAADNLRDAPNPVAAVVSDIAGDARPKARTATGGATASQVEHAFAQALVYLSLGYIFVSARGLPLADDQADALALADDEAAAIAAPLARAFAASDLNSRYGRQLVDNSDVLEAIFVAGNYVRRTTKVLASIRAEIGPRQTGRPSPAAAPHPTPTGGPSDTRPGPQPEPAPAAPGGPGEEPPPPRPSYAPYTPGSQLTAD